MDKQHGQETNCPGQEDESHDPATFTLRDGGISQLLPEIWISSQAASGPCLGRGAGAKGECSEAPWSWNGAETPWSHCRVDGLPSGLGLSSCYLEMVETQEAQKPT